MISMMALILLRWGGGELSSSWAEPQETKLGSQPTWGELQRWALKNAPQIRGARAHRAASQAMIGAVEQWPRLKLNYRYSPLPIETKRGETPHALGISQPLLWHDEWGARRGVAEAERAISQAQLDQLELQLIEELERALWRLWAIESRSVIFKRKLMHLTALRADLSARAESGSSALSASQRVVFQHARIKERHRQLKNEGLKVRVDLGRLLNLSTPFNAPPPLDLVPPIPRDPQALLSGPSMGPHQRLKATELAKLRAQQPEIQGAEANQARARAQLQKLMIEQRPRLEIGVQWVFVSEPDITSDPNLLSSSMSTNMNQETRGNDALVLWLGTSLPLWRHAEQSARAAAHAEMIRQSALIDTLSQAWRAQVSSIAIDLEEQRERLEAIRQTLIPNADLLVSTLLGELEAGSAMPAQLYEAQLKRDQLDLEQIAVIERWGFAHARWRRLSAPQALKAHRDASSSEALRPQEDL